MSIAVSPVASEAASPMITSVTPTLESVPKEEQPGPCGSSSIMDGVGQARDPCRSYQKPPPLHTGADWKVVLHLPEIETWLRATAERVSDLTHSVQQDSLNRHVDVHLVQLKDICEDISDHVEQIHALLETEFSLKLLSYSVNIIVDIRSVQLLWHQLRVSVLVLKERLLQGLQDSNGNYTRQTDILQAFSQDHDQARLDALTEVDDSGQLTIKCSQDYFSLDCGITAYELSDYSPHEEDIEGRVSGQETRSLYPELERDFPELLQSVDLLTIAASRQSQEPPPESTEGTQSGPGDQSPSTGDSMQGSTFQGENGLGLSKRPLQGSHSSKVSPTQPSMPKKPMYMEASLSRPSPLQYQADISRSTPSLLDLPDRSKFWLELETVYPSNGSQSDENLHMMNGKNRQANRQATFQKHITIGRALIPLQRSSSESRPEYSTETTNLHLSPKNKPSNNKSNSDFSSLPSSSGEDTSDHDPHESSSSPDNHAGTTGCLWIMPHAPQPANSSPKDDCWYGSEEFLALPAQLRKTEMLALKLESLAQALPPRALQQPIQDVDDWELTEANPEWESGLHLLPPQSYKKQFTGRCFSSSSSDVAPSVDESIESGPLSDLISEDEGGWSRPESRRTERNALQPKVSQMVFQCTPLIQQLLQDIQHQENYQDIWGKIEGFVSKLDEFICWLREALEATENWTPPRADTDSLRLYLETHLSFKLNVDSHSALKDSVLEEGRQLLELITSHKSGLQDMLQMIAHQWQELQRQIRRQHSWMLRTLDTIKARIVASEGSPDPEDPVDLGPHASPKSQVQQCHAEAQRDIVDQMSLKLRSQQYSSSSRNRDFSLMSKFNSLSEFQTEYQELWDWLMDMESIVTDSHELMMSEEQQHHLYKGNSVEMAMWLPKKTQLLGWAESLKRSSTELPADFEECLTALRAKWNQLEKTLGEHVEVRAGDPGSRRLLSPGTSSMVAQLESKIKELKSWLRDTELFIFNLSLRADAQHQNHTQQDPQPNSQHDPREDPQLDPEVAKQLEHFKALCVEVRGRRKGIASVLRLCQRLLEGPEEQSSEAERQSLQLLQVNLERRWEAIIMQVLQWQSRLKRTLGREQVPGNLIEPSLMDLRGQTEDSWEWDEMDMTIDNMESQECDIPSEMPLHSVGELLNVTESCPTQPTTSLSTLETNPMSSQVYQVYNLHHVELYQQPQYNHKSSPNTTKTKGKQPLLKSLSKDSSFSSVESLPDILGGLLSGKQGLLTDLARRSESESGIVSEGDTETTANSEICLLYQCEDQKITPPIRSESPCIDQLSDEDIDRILQRANKCAELGDSLAEETKNQRFCMVRRKKEESGESRRKHRKEPVEILINGRCVSPESEDCDTGAFSAGADDKGRVRKEHSQLSQGSSLDSLYAVGELFPSAKETLTRSTSLESWLAPCKASEEVGSQGSLRDIGLAPEPTGELSRRTLELLKRLENIRTPLAQKMTRSVSDVTLQSSSLRLPCRGQRSGGPASSANESLAASLTELSSVEDSSVASEDLAVQKNRHVAVNSNNSFKKHCRNQQLTDETDASISMVVNVSCTSACTDDEDDSDLLSSSTLTLTEEELGIKDDEDSSITSEEEYIEGSFALGLGYMKGEFQSWIKHRSQNKEKNEADLGDELRCGTLSREILSPVRTTTDRQFLNRAALKLLEANTNARNDSLKQEEADSSRRDATRSYISRFVDDMENGNVDSSHIKGKDEDDELLREEGTLFTKKGESCKDCRTVNALNGDITATGTAASPASCEQLNPQSKESSLEGQLKGELPCHSSRRPSPSLSPMDECSGSHHNILGAAHLSSQERLASFLNDVHENHSESLSGCCRHPSFPAEEENSENVHSFVMEIIDMASVAKKTKDAQTEHPQEASSPTSVSQIREKVLEHSHRHIHLRKGDFYNYLSLSSHDSDCGEVSTCTEDKSSTPVLSRTPEIRDEEPLFEACTEEVYLGPPLCYSMSISKWPMRRSTKLIDPLCPLSQAPPLACDEYQKAHSISPGSIAGSQPQCHNEAPYLNPLPCETLIDTVECFADTKMLESNISPVMTKISVSCSSTNPLKEEGGLYINPKINCPPIRKSDRDERGAASQWMKQKNVKKGRSSPQEAKSTHKQLPRSEGGVGLPETGRRASFSTRRSDSSSAVRSGVSSRPQARVPTKFAQTLASHGSKA
ncbi:A-kinase anchor protein 6 [Astyanax mexicanus]|uniref:A-kinase anchor protein 6 n=1 Tax=Astyanax mexicanus TaxID=7994 RepID=A0A8T2LCK2_ASTMX|nr:A-kinase anchor protein 6 [Astyanax mexicanus]